MAPKLKLVKSIKHAAKCQQNITQQHKRQGESILTVNKPLSKVLKVERI